MQDIANALDGTSMTVFVKNSIHPDLHLWIGNVERIAAKTSGLVGAIHRGFSLYDTKDKYRNRPNWAIPLEFKRLMPEFPLICDPSHISGKREYIFELSQKAWNMDFDGLMIETHPDPLSALSDADQQIELPALLDYLHQWTLFDAENVKLDKASELEYFRSNIDAVDSEIIELLAKRMQYCESIGKVKNDLKIPAYIPERWDSVLKSRSLQGQSLDLPDHFIQELYSLIHQLSISAQHKYLIDKSPKTDTSAI